MNKKNQNLQAIIETAIFSAIAVVLDMIQGGLFKGVFTSGGSIGIAMLPILIICFRRGLGYGLLSGLIVSLLQMLSGVYVVQASDMPNDFLRAVGPFIQIMLDYILAYTLVGFAGLFYKPFKNAKTNGKKILYVSLGTILGGILKYLSHVISGVVFWLGSGSNVIFNVRDYRPLYSWVYNGAYCIPNIIICLILIICLVHYYPNIFDVNKEKTNEEQISD